MKKMMKTVVIALVACGLIAGVSSCSKHTCPTYSKANTQTEPRG